MTILHHPSELTGDYSGFMQYRPAVAPNGRFVQVPITPEDRKRAFAALPAPTGWREIMREREAGIPIERIWKKRNISWEDFLDGLDICYAWIETRLHNLAHEKIGSNAHLQAPLPDHDRRALESMVDLLENPPPRPRTF